MNRRREPGRQILGERNEVNQDNMTTTMKLTMRKPLREGRATITTMPTLQELHLFITFCVKSRGNMKKGNCVLVKTYN